MKKVLSTIMLLLIVSLTFLTFAPQGGSQPLAPSNWIRLTTNPLSDCDPTWSSDGNEIVYRAHQPHPWGVHGYIWVMRANGSDQRQLEDYGISEGPDVSPDGSQIVFGNYIGGDYFALTIMKYDGTDLHHIYGGPSQGSLQRMCWSPTGDKIVSQTTQAGPWPPYQILLINPDGSDPVMLTSEGSNSFPWWSPDGAKIVFVSERSGHPEIWVMDANGGNQHRLIPYGNQPKWSPDGSKIIFVHENHIWVMNADGTNLMQLTDSQEREEFPEISPDGRWVVFVAWVNGLRNIYKMPIPALLSITVDIYPDTLNLRSKGRWITCYIELPEGYDVSDIDVSTILLNQTVVAELEPTAIGDYDNDSVPDLMVIFNRTQVVDYIIAEEVTCGNTILTLTGQLYSGIFFEGSDTLKVSSLIGDVNCDGRVAIDDLVLAATSYGSKEDEPYWNCNANFAQPWNIIDICDLVTIAAHYGETCP